MCQHIQYTQGVDLNKAQKDLLKKTKRTIKTNVFQVCSLGKDRTGSVLRFHMCEQKRKPALPNNFWR